jgi:2-hydroxy-3-keto-5-methylthiopentenyl-1-phosphate phosphatase
LKQLAVVTDFDGTLMLEDVGDFLMDRLKVREQPETKLVSRMFKEKKIGSLEWIKVAYTFLAPHQQIIDDLLTQVRLREGALEFLEFCRKMSIPVTVLSDGMEYYVRKLLDRYDIQVEQVIVNPIRYTGQGGYELGTQNRNEACRWCGCCKAEVVRSMKESGRQIVYIGDGSSDFYGSSFADWVFARGSLTGYLQQDEVPYYPFESFYDVLSVLENGISAFRAGTAPKRLDRVHPFCRFA